MDFNSFVIRLLIVILIGFIIGFERQLTGHNVSFKTTILIAIGSYAFIATEVFIGSDATRMAANVITGIGFLCSGVIFKNGLSVNGLTTAAALWCTSAFAVLVGYGYVEEGLIGTVLVLFANVFSAAAAKHVRPILKHSHSSDAVYYIKVECLQADVKKIKKIVLEEMPARISIDSFEIDNLTGTKRRLIFTLSSQGNIVKDVSDICDRIMEKDIISVTYEVSEE